MSAAILDIEEDMELTSWEAELLVGSLNVIAAFGGLIAGACVCSCVCLKMKFGVKASVQFFLFLSLEKKGRPATYGPLGGLAIVPQKEHGFSVVE